MLETVDKVIDETKQGEAIQRKNNTSTSNGRKVYIESYGCQMNFSDSEIVASILEKDGYETTRLVEEADIIFVNTCSIREKAEQTVRKRLSSFNKVKKRNPKMIIGSFLMVALNTQNLR